MGWCSWPVLATSCIAGLPPKWEEFEVLSSNRQYVARVTVTDRSGASEPRHWRYALTVAKRSNDVEHVVWTCRYEHDGLSTGKVSEDGSVFVHVPVVYRDDLPLVVVYARGRLVGSLTSEDLGLDRARHFEPDGVIPGGGMRGDWLSMDAVPYELMHAAGGQLALRLRTKERGNMLLDLQTLKLSLEK
jgi:hypothetical protein